MNKNYLNQISKTKQEYYWKCLCCMDSGVIHHEIVRAYIDPGYGIDAFVEDGLEDPNHPGFPIINLAVPPHVCTREGCRGAYQESVNGSGESRLTHKFPGYGVLYADPGVCDRIHRERVANRNQGFIPKVSIDSIGKPMPEAEPMPSPVVEAEPQPTPDPVVMAAERGFKVGDWVLVTGGKLDAAGKRELLKDGIPIGKPAQIQSFKFNSVSLKRNPPKYQVLVSLVGVETATSLNFVELMEKECIPQ